MNRTPAVVIVAFVALSLLCGSLAAARSPGGPATKDEAAAVYREAREAYGQGDFTRAAALLRQVIAMQPERELYWNLGRAEEKAGNLAEAIDAYQRFLESDPPEADRAQATERLATVKAALGHGWLSITADATGAVARIDGAASVDLPAERVPVPAGQRSVTVEAPGREPATVSANVPSGDVITLDVVLDSVSATLVPPPGNDLGVWAWATLGAGVALAAGGGTLLALGRADAAAVEDADRDAAGRVISVGRAEALDLADSAAAKSDAGVALLAVGGGALATSILLFVLDVSADEAPAALAPVVWPGGVALGGRF